MSNLSDDAQLQTQLLERLRVDAGFATLDADPDADDRIRQLRTLMGEMRRLFMTYEFGIREVETKIAILREEFEQMHDTSPIEHVRTRLKTHESVFRKALQRGCELSVEGIRGAIFDIAGIRITCSFVSDVYWIAEMLSKQPDVRVLETKDYIADPKLNGYRSLHLIIEIPVFLSTHTEHVPVELQIRTIAMDFWASIEHKLSYKYDTEMPAQLAEQLNTAAHLATELDERMGRLRDEVRPQV